MINVYIIEFYIVAVGDKDSGMVTVTVPKDEIIPNGRFSFERVNFIHSK